MSLKMDGVYVKCKVKGSQSILVENVINSTKPRANIVKRQKGMPPTLSHLTSLIC